MVTEYENLLVHLNHNVKKDELFADINDKLGNHENPNL